MTMFKRVSIIVMLAIYLVLIPVFFRGSQYVLHVFIMCSQLSIVSLTVRVVFNVGELSFGQVVFVMAGAYASAILSTKVGLPFWLSLPLSGLISAAFAGLIGRAIFRLRGTYFSILTVILTEVARQGIRSLKYLGGPQGFHGIPRPEAVHIGKLILVPQFDATDRLPYYFVTAALLTITLLALGRLENSPTGAAFKATRQNAAVAQSLGINVARHRIMALSISAFFAGLVGSFTAHYVTIFYPETFSLWNSIDYVLYAFIGGIGNIWGPIIGSFALTWLWEYLGPSAQYRMVLFAVLVIVVILFLPGGIVSLVKSFPSLGGVLGKVLPRRAVQPDKKRRER